MTPDHLAVLCRVCGKNPEATFPMIGWELTQLLGTERDIMTPNDLAQMRLVCRDNPSAVLTLPGWELGEILEALEAAERRENALREHLERRHGCGGDCVEPGL